MDISVIVPFCNSERYIEQCINALLAQSYPADHYEIIMVNNNSTDKSEYIVRQYPKIKLFSESKQSSYAARNRGIAESTGAILAFTDADCLPYSNWLENIWKVMKNPEISIIQGRRRFASESPCLAILSDYEASKAEYIFTSNFREKYYGYTNNMAVRRSVFERNGPFMTVSRGADVLFVQQVIKDQTCKAVTFVADAFVQHLEITKIWSWYRKMTIYGRSWKNYHKVTGYSPLTTADRLRIFNKTIKRGQYSVKKSLFLLSLLSLGVLYYEIGRRF